MNCPTSTAPVTARNGLLWRNGEMIRLPEADRVAVQHGYQYAEQLVRALQAKSQNAKLRHGEKETPMKTPETQSGSSIDPLVLKPRHKWFSACDRECGDGWWGPHDTIEAAATECVCNAGRESRIFICHGHKLAEAERYSEFAWEVDAKNAFEVILPNDQAERLPANTP